MVRSVEVRGSDVMTHSPAANWTRLIVLSVLFFLIFLALIGCGGRNTDVTITEPASTSVDLGDAPNLTATVANALKQERELDNELFRQLLWHTVQPLCLSRIRYLHRKDGCRSHRFRLPLCGKVR